MSKVERGPLRPLLRDVVEGIRAEPSRTGLSVLAIAIGIAALTVLLAVLGGLRLKARTLVRDLGANVIAVTSPQFDVEGTGRTLEERDAAKLDAGLGWVRDFVGAASGTPRRRAAISA